MDEHDETTPVPTHDSASETAGAPELHGRGAGLRPMRDVIAELTPDFPDLSHSSLRFLERERLIAPSRSEGGHRLFSDDDVARIRQIKRWQARRLSLEEIRNRLIELDRLPPTDHLADRFLRHAIAGDRAAAFQTISAADDAGMPLIRLMGEVLHPALTELGRLWETNEVLVAQEKEVSELTRDLIAELFRRHAVAESDGPVVIAACVEDELHELGLRIVSGMLRTWGYRVHYLGADVPPWFLLDATLLRRPDAILLSAKLSSHLDRVKASIDFLTERLTPEATPPFIVGGRMALEHAETLRSWGAIPVIDERLESAVGAVTSVLPIGSARR